MPSASAHVRIKKDVTGYFKIKSRQYTDKTVHRLVRVFSDVLVAFLYFDICHYRQSNLAIKNPEFSQPVVAGHFQ